MLLVEQRKINKKEIIVVSSRDVAETFNKEHYHVIEDIRAIQGKISSTEFSGLFYEDSYTASNGKKNPMYLMNRDGFTLLVMGYTGEKAMKFKLSYINQFNQMEQMLQSRLIEREKGIVIRQAFTKVLKESGENERMHNMAYSTYTDLAYRSLFGKAAKQFREEFNLTKRDNLRDYFCEEDLKKIQNTEMLISSLMGYGWGYKEISDFIMDKGLNKITA